jgi:hypothetical protein
MSTNTPTNMQIRDVEETSDGAPILGRVVDGLPLREEPDGMEGGRVDSGRGINNPDLTGEPLRINTNNHNVPNNSNHTPGRRNRSRTIDCILGSPISPLPSSLSPSTPSAAAANRNRTGTISRGPPVSSPIIENDTENHVPPQAHPVTSTSVDLVLPESTERDLKLNRPTSDSISASSTGSGHRKSLSSHRERATEDDYKYPPPLRISNDGERNQDRDLDRGRDNIDEGGMKTGRTRARTGSVSWFKQTLGMNAAGTVDSRKVDEEMGLTGKDKRDDTRRSSSSKGDDDEGTEARERREEQAEEEEDVHRDEVVDHLNVIDAQVSAGKSIAPFDQSMMRSENLEDTDIAYVSVRQ